MTGAEDINLFEPPAGAAPPNDVGRIEPANPRPGGAFSADAPLAVRMRPRSFDELVGQEHLLAPGRLLHRMLESGRLRSLILFGPPGTGKTSLVAVMARRVGLPVSALNAVSSGVKDLRHVIELARAGGPRLLHVDEVHRFARNQVEALLPAVEDGLVVFVGTTTENPFLSLPPALRSRCTILELHRLAPEAVVQALRRALTDEDRGLGAEAGLVDDALLDDLAHAVGGDLRAALNALELAVLAAPEGAGGATGGRRVVTREWLFECLRRELQTYSESDTYDLISALQKSVRGSDPDAALHYLARLVSVKADLDTLARRVVVMAAEDVGNAYPQAVGVALAAVQAARMVGYPEARIPLAQAVSFLASCPKSNAANEGLNRALADVEAGRGLQVPAHLRSTGYKGADRLGRGAGYQYPHAFPGNWVAQQYLPDELARARYYEPSANGFEQQIRDRLQRLREQQNAADGGPPDPNSPIDPSSPRQ